MPTGVAPHLEYALEGLIPEGLDRREWVFVQNLRNGMSQAQAAKNAGYSNPTRIATELLKRAEVIKVLRAEFDRTAKELEITRQDVLEGLKEAIEAARLMSDPQAMIAGWREIAKICGYYAPEEKRITLNSDQQGRINEMDEMSDEELAALMGKEALTIDGEFTKE